MTITFNGSNALLGKDAPFESFSYQALLGGAGATMAADGTFSLAVNNVTSLDMPTVSAFISAGGGVENLPVFIKMSAAKYTTDVPAGISNGSYADENDITITRSWSEWKDSNHQHHDATDGDKIVPGNGWGVELTAAEISTLSADSDYTLLLAHEVEAYMDVGEE